MSKDLYFIKLLTRALGSPDPKNALRQAFSDIKQLGHKPQYSNGHKQFLQFMSIVNSSIDSGEYSITPDLLRKHMEEWMDQTGLGEPLPAIVLECDGEIAGVADISETKSIESVRGLEPGNYLLRLETGQVLWQGELSIADLYWRHAFPEDTLPLAAETDKAIVRSSREFDLLDGELTIRILPGRTSGRMDIIFNG